MNEIVTARRVHANDLTDPQHEEARGWLARLGYPIPARPVYQAEIDVIDCPLLRLWWLTDNEVAEIPNDVYGAPDFEITDHCHIDEIAMPQLPSWWKPEGLPA